jgi:hypothetical protein
MRARLMDSYEGVERLRLDEVVDPQPGAAAAISAADLCIIHASYVARLDRTLPHRILQGLLAMAWPRRAATCQKTRRVVALVFVSLT